MRFFAIILAILSIVPHVHAMDIKVCNLNPDYGYDVSTDQVRITNTKGEILSISKAAISLNGKPLGATVSHEHLTRLDATLREAIPSAIEVSRLSYTMSLAGLSKDFYSRHREDRWIPYMKSYRQRLLDRFDTEVKLQPRIVITPGGLSRIGSALHGVSRTGVSTQMLQSIAPAKDGKHSLEEELASLDAFGSDGAMERASGRLCQRIQALNTAEAKVLTAVDLAGRFDIGVMIGY